MINAISHKENIKLPKLCFIARKHEYVSPQRLVKEVCRAGVKMVQLNTDLSAYDEILSLAEKCVEVCDDYDSLFLLNGHVDVAKELNVDGVFLDHADMHPGEAREILGKRCIIGAYADSYDRVEDIFPYVNYVSLGPMRADNHDSNIDTYLAIIANCRANRINIPIFASEGIHSTDIPAILQGGFYGIGVSRAITQADDISWRAEELLQIVDENDFRRFSIELQKLNYEIRNHKAVRPLS